MIELLLTFGESVSRKMISYETDQEYHMHFPDPFVAITLAK